MSGRGRVFLIPKEATSSAPMGQFRVLWFGTLDLEKATKIHPTHPEMLGLVRGRTSLRGFKFKQKAERESGYSGCTRPDSSLSILFHCMHTTLGDRTRQPFTWQEDWGSGQSRTMSYIQLRQVVSGHEHLDDLCVHHDCVAWTSQQIRATSVYGYYSGIVDSVSKNDRLLAHAFARAMDFEMPTVVLGDQL